MHAPPKPDYPIFEPTQLSDYNAFLFGIPTRYGNLPAQWKTFWDATGQLWLTSALHGKFAGVFVSTGSLGGGLESTVLNTLTTLCHHGMIFVPLGYKHTFKDMMTLTEVHGEGPFGSGTLAVSGPMCASIPALMFILGGRWSFTPTICP